MLNVEPFRTNVRPVTADSISSVEGGDKKESRGIAHKLVSIRSVLLLITLITVICLSAGLIVINVNGQHAIAGDLGMRIMQDINTVIFISINELFSLADSQSKLSTYFFNDMNIPPMGGSLRDPWKPVFEHMWSITRSRESGVFTKFQLDDARFFGLDNFNGAGDIYIFDFVNGTLICNFWDAPLNKSILDVNLSLSNVIPGTTIVFPPPYPIYDPYVVNTIGGKCGALLWSDVQFFGGIQANWEQVTLFRGICNRNGTFLGRLAISVQIQTISDLLDTLTEEYDGKMFIMDRNSFYLVASSTHTPIFGKAADLYSFPPRVRANETDERWIRDVLDELGDKDDENRFNIGRKIKFNGTEYLLSETPYAEFGSMNWTIVKLLKYDQFLGNSQAFINRSIYAAIGVAISAVFIVLVVTYLTTKPLFMLAHDLNRMSRLETNYQPIDTPRLFEVQKLYRSVVGMNMALRSFKKFVPLQVVTRIIQNQEEVTPELKFGNITIMFQDIEGFTSITEKMDPLLLAKLMGEYMSLMTDIIVKHNGTIDKYVGDCIMSLFNAPNRVSDHKVVAVDAAVECVRALAQKNAEWKRNYGVELNCRTGIHTGEVLVGNMGSDNRMNYTAFGDNVNIASRLEGVNKHYGTKIAISKQVLKAIPKGKYPSRKLGEVKVTGKNISTKIYEVKASATNDTLELFSLYQAALKAFKTQDFSAAIAKLNQATLLDPSDSPSLLLKERTYAAIRMSESSEGLPSAWTHIETPLK